MSVLDDVFAALAHPASVILQGVATLTGRIALTHDGPGGQSTAIFNVIASGVVEPASLTYAPPLGDHAAAVRFSMPLYCIRPAHIAAAESTAVTLTRNAAVVPFYTIDLSLPWVDLAFTANVDPASGVIYGSAADQLLALALAIECEPHPEPDEAVQSVGRNGARRLREPRRRQR